MTPRQSQVLECIRSIIASGRSPGRRSVAKALGISEDKARADIAALIRDGLVTVAQGAIVAATEEDAPALLRHVPKKEDFTRLVNASRKSPSVEALCNELDLSPASLRAMVERARVAGMAVRVSDGHVGIGHEPATGESYVSDPPPTGKRFLCGVLSDIHAGSKYCLRPCVKDAVGRMYRAGVRDVLIPGDLLDGCYRHGEFELTYSGLTEQTDDLSRILPQLDGLKYHAITGNHDFTFTERTGADVGSFIVGRFAALGRRDLAFYGDRAATLRIGGTSVRLLHPSGSCSYAISYKLQKFVEAFDSGEKPGVLLVGHYHRSCYIYTRSVHAIACPTMQGPGSAFGKSLGMGPQAMGALIIGWKLTSVATLRDFVLRPLSYFRHEQAKEAMSATTP